MNLYVDSEVTLKMGTSTVRIVQTTNYPWDGQVKFAVYMDRPTAFTLKLRAPGWLGQGPLASDLYTFDRSVTDRIDVWDGHLGGGVEPRAGWIDHRVTKAIPPNPDLGPLTFVFPMPVRRVTANPGVKDDLGKAAIQRGPIVYALEAVDNGGKVLDVPVPMNTTFTPAFKPDVLGGVSVLTATIPATADAPARTIIAVPYYAWANRGRGEMVVWIKQ